MGKPLDLLGQHFGRLTVIRFAGHRSFSGPCYRFWECLCECGARVDVATVHLRNGHTQSCGCLQAQRAAERVTKHMLSRSTEFKIWVGMNQRCYNPTATNYKNYGGRGIRVCNRWRVFLLFLADMGKRPSAKHSIERRDNARGYSPDNCYWATRAEQDNNKRTNRWLRYDGKRLTLTQWAHIRGIHTCTLYDRLRRGWTVKRTLSEPVWATRTGRAV